MTTSSVFAGTPLGLQLPAVFQSVLVAPVQSLPVIVNELLVAEVSAPSVAVSVYVPGKSTWQPANAATPLAACFGLFVQLSVALFGFEVNASVTFDESPVTTLLFASIDGDLRLRRKRSVRRCRSRRLLREGELVRVADDRERGARARRQGVAARPRCGERDVALARGLRVGHVVDRGGRLAGQDRAGDRAAESPGAEVVNVKLVSALTGAAAPVPSWDCTTTLNGEPDVTLLPPLTDVIASFVASGAENDVAVIALLSVN